jgi:hypothetical protein
MERGMRKLFSIYKHDFKPSVLTATVLHFLVDYISISVLVNSSLGVNAETAGLYAVIYDFLAFATQPLVGVVADFLHKEKYFVLGSIALLLIGFFIPFSYVALGFVGIGNALFHVFAGKNAMDESEKSAPLGVFISTGALGLSLALNYSLPRLRYVFLALLVVLGALYFYLRLKEEPLVKEEQAKVSPKDKKNVYLIPIILVSLGVLIRAVLGYLPTYSGSALTIEPILVALFVFLGKAIGGFILDAFGAIPLMIASVVFTSLGIISYSEPIFRFLFCLGVNLPMAFTLYYAKKALPRYSGFAFGLLAALLLLGLLLTSYQMNEIVISCLSVTLSLFSAIMCIAVGYFFKKKDTLEGKEEETL